jgi:hypothetical protein
MTLHSLFTAPMLASAMAAAGLTVGLGYFALLRRTVQLYGSGHSHLGPVAFTLARLVGAAVSLAFAARLGAPSLLAAFLGFLAARTIALRRARRVI